MCGFPIFQENQQIDLTYQNQFPKLIFRDCEELFYEDFPHWSEQNLGVVCYHLCNNHIL